MKKRYLLLFFVLFLFPFSIFAYSNHVFVGGDTIGIEVHSKGVYVVGFYPVNQRAIAEISGFQVGDVIRRVNGNEVDSIHDLNQLLDETNANTFTVLRNSKEIEITHTLEREDDILKTGLFVKDQINGIGTLSYIDPETKVFGSLGHEILESSSFSKFEINDGTIYKAEVSSIKKSQKGLTGEKNAIIHKNQEQGEITSNEVVGIFGHYTGEVNDYDLFEVGHIEDIRRGEATIRTVLQDQDVEDFSIKILSIDESDTSKNILFEITDADLLRLSGGVVQGMSGSPILQNDKIIGVVNYVIVDDVKRGYGVFITTMLEEGDKTLS